MKHFIKKYKSEIIVGISALSAGILSFFLTLNIRPILKENSLNVDELEVVDLPQENTSLNFDVEKVREDIREFEELANAIEAADKVVNVELEENKNDVNYENEDIGTDNIEVINASNAIEEATVDVIIATSDKLESKKELVFELPTSGDIVLDYAKDKLVYSETLEEWITHDGVDIKAKEGVPVKAAESGVITEIKMDPRYGNLIVIKHDEEYQTVYSNLNMIDNMYVGKEIEKGEIIATVAEGFGFESREGPHVHFEILKNGETQKPY